jgi:hypothetical protein
MRQPTLRRQPVNLVSTKEAAERKKKLGLEGVQRPRGFGYVPLPDPAGAEYSDRERTDDAKKLFIEQCVRAYAAGILSHANPPPQRTIMHEIRKAGGNIKWLSINLGRQRIFHSEYCRLLRRPVPFEKVWQKK